MKKILYILLIGVMLCGCEGNNNDHNNDFVEQLPKEKVLLEYAKKQFVGEKYELVESNLWTSHRIPLRGIIADINITNEFDNCDNEGTRIDYSIIKDFDNNIIGIIQIYIYCGEQNELHTYYSYDNYTNGTKLDLNG